MYQILQFDMLKVFLKTIEEILFFYRMFLKRTIEWLHCNDPIFVYKELWNSMSASSVRTQNFLELQSYSIRFLLGLPFKPKNIKMNAVAVSLWKNKSQ